MKHACLMFLCGLPLFFLSVANGQGLIYRLPQAGTWAVYALTGDATMQDGSVSKVNGTLTVRLLGNEYEEMEPLCWIELHFKGEHIGPIPGKRETHQLVETIDKLLVPEKHLGHDKSPLQHIKKAWRAHSQIDGMEPRQLNPDKHQVTGLLDPLLHGPFADRQELNTATVTTEAGKFECGGFAATDSSEEPRSSIAYERSYRVRTSPKAPFGIVTWECLTDVVSNGEKGTITLKLELQSTGTSAKSALPENN